jgi:hypothetical protein
VFLISPLPILFVSFFPGSEWLAVFLIMLISLLSIIFYAIFLLFVPFFIFFTSLYAIVFTIIKYIRDKKKYKNARIDLSR